jgi:rsbT co-antagonist protein RsbR
MANSSEEIIKAALQNNAQNLSQRWQEELTGRLRRPDLMNQRELEAQCAEFLQLINSALARGSVSNIDAPAWNDVRDFLTRISRSRAEQGFTATETALFVFSLKRPVFNALRESDSAELVDAIWCASEWLDALGLYTSEVHQEGRDEIISRQQEEMLELSTPVVKLWDGILALPMIGTLDSNRTQVAMEALLQKIVETNSEVAIIDITGVPTVDTLVAQHLMKTVAAARLMGVDCIVSGVRPQIAQTIVHLGVDLGNIVTKATLADAFKMALKGMGASLKPSHSS